MEQELKRSETIRYFAYGSNLGSQQIQERCSDYRKNPKEPDKAKAFGWRLRFPREESSRKGGVASIEPVADVSHVIWGVVYSLTPEDRKRLDMKEGIQPGRDPSLNSYYWQDIAVLIPRADGSTDEEIVGTYLANPGQEHLPSTDYIDLIISGARQRELPDDYISKLIAIRQTIERNPNEFGVAIVGGGLAGLYCAYQLRYKTTYRLFEETDRLGGRILSTRIRDGQLNRQEPYDREEDVKRLDFCAEFGPMRIELEQQELLADLLTKDLGITAANGDFEPFPPYASPASPHDPKYELDGEEAEQKTPMDLLVLAFVRIVGRLTVPNPDHKFWPPDGNRKEVYHFAKRLKEAIEALTRAAATRQANWTDVFVAWINKLEEPDYQLFRKYAIFDDGTESGTPLYLMGFWNLLTDVLSHHAVMKIRDFGTFYHLIPENPNAVEWLIFWLRGLKTSQTMKGIVGGMQRISEELENRIPFERISRALKLVAIAADENDATTAVLQFERQSETGKTLETVRAKHVILALPKASLEEIVIRNTASFATEVCGAMDAVFGFPMVKLFLVVKKRWWPKDAASLTNRYATALPTRELHFMSSRRKDSDIGMVLIYTDRPASAFLANYVLQPGAQLEPEWRGAESNVRLIRKAVQYLNETGATGIAEDNFKFSGIRDWGRKPYSGANHAWRPERKSWEVLRTLSEFALDQSPAVGSAAATMPATRNIHVCGEAYSDYHGFMEGALRSATHVLHAIYKSEFPTKTPWLCDTPPCDLRDPLHSVTRQRKK